ncbi:hypothetical protein BJ742DRAFT_265869 [Cladochytrium replicatum]|nr:hypothetical protein BJ742DRAFT_265869 [Cladochytrium replicatum]
MVHVLLLVPKEIPKGNRTSSSSRGCSGTVDSPRDEGGRHSIPSSGVEIEVHRLGSFESGQLLSIEMGDGWVQMRLLPGKGIADIPALRFVAALLENVYEVARGNESIGLGLVQGTVDMSSPECPSVRVDDDYRGVPIDHKVGTLNNLKQLAHDILNGLRKLQERGFVHRNICVTNILFAAPENGLGNPMGCLC